MSFELKDETIAGLSPEAQGIVRALLAHIGVPEKRIAELEASLNKTSKNSSKPPSSSPPHAKPDSPPSANGVVNGALSRGMTS